MSLTDWSRFDTGGVCGSAIVALLLVPLMLIGGPVLAHGEDGEAEPVELVEQALAIVVNTPDSMGEAAEKLEAVLEADPAGLMDLDVEAVARALAAVEAGDAHAAEDALIEALGQDPHPEEAVEGPEGTAGATGTTEAPTSETTMTPTTVTTVTPTTAPAGEGGGGEDEDNAEAGLLSTPILDHGLTERLEGGLRSPGIFTLLLAVILAGAGTYLLRRRVPGP